MWEILRKNKAKLNGIGRALQGPGSFQVDIDNNQTSTPGLTNWTKKRVVVNPSWFHRHDHNEQWELTKDVLIHEAGHRRFTGEIDAGGGVIHNVWNVLEDGRIERQMGLLYPHLQDRIKNLCKTMTQYGSSKGTPLDNPITRLITYSMYKRAGQEYFDECDVEAWVSKDWDEWEDVKPLIDESFTAEDSHEVLDIAREILKILNIQPDLPPPPGIPRAATPCCDGQRDESVDGMPIKVDEEGNIVVDEDGEDGDRIDGQSGAGNDVDIDRRYVDIDANLPEVPPMVKKEDHPNGITRNEVVPRDPTELEQMARKILPDIERALKVQGATETFEPAGSGGKLKVQQWIKDNELPFRRTVIAEGTPESAIAVIVDCSTSMYEDDTCDRVAELTMAIYLASKHEGTACNVMTAPGGINVCNNNTAESQALPLIAGLSKPWASYEEIDRILNLQGDWLRGRSEPVKIVFVLHDGMSNDARRVPGTVKRLKREGVKVIAMGLGIRSEGLYDQYGKESYIQMDDVTKVGAKVATVIKNLRRG